MTKSNANQIPLEARTNTGHDNADGAHDKTLGDIGLTHFVPYLMNRIMGRWNASLQEELRDYDLTTAKMRTLAVLSVCPELTISELSGYAVIEQSTLSRSLDALETQGMIRRVASDTDGRVREIRITSTGRATFNKFWPTMQANYNDLLAGLSTDEHESLLNILKKLLQNVQNTKAEHRQ